MKDLLPSESHKWQYVEDVFRTLAETYGYKEIRTPMVESTELFARGIGDTTDVVQKEMYSFEKADRSLTLKPEGTAGVVRAFIENKLYAEGLPANTTTLRRATATRRCRREGAGSSTSSE